MKLIPIFAAALTLITPLAATAAYARPAGYEANRYASAEYNRIGYSSRNHDRGDRFRSGRTWRDDQGRTCYRRSDGVRRCEANVRGASRYDRRRY